MIIGCVDNIDNSVFFIDLDVPGGIGPNKYVVHVPPEYRMPAVQDLPLQHQAHELLCGWRHIPEALADL